MTHRYRVRPIIKDGQDPRYLLVDERGGYIYRETIGYDEYEPVQRFERMTFATPEDAWESIKDTPHIPADTTLYKYTFYPKAGGVSFEYISQQRSTDRINDQWMGLETTDGEHVHISLVELLRFVVREV